VFSDDDVFFLRCTESEFKIWPATRYGYTSMLKFVAGDSDNR